MLLGRFGDPIPGDGDAGGDDTAGTGDGSRHSQEGEGVELEPSDAAVDFRQRLDQIMHTSACPTASSGTHNAHAGKVSPKGAHTGGDTPHQSPVPQKVYTRPTQKQKVVGGMLDKDLKAYFMVEDHTRRLSNMGFYEKDDFMNFD